MLGAHAPDHCSAAEPGKTLSSEAYAGADVARDVWLLYSGVTLAPFDDIHADGVRMRASGGYGQYAYSGQRQGSLRYYEATFAYAEALLGYQKRVGPLTAKAFVGIAAIDHTINPGDPIALGGLLTQGMDYGFKGVLELWLNLGSDAWTSLDTSWTTAHQTYAARWRLGWRVLPTLSLGVESAVNGNALDAPDILANGSRREKLEPSARLGLFARYEWATGELSLSSGFASYGLDLDRQPSWRDAYGTVNWLVRF
ncbi:MAG: cellulose biosynthesis protein BcsS [Hyphomicrobiaceae bacterium]